MNAAVAYDLRLSVGVLAAAGLVGALLDVFWPALALVAIALLGLQLYRLHALWRYSLRAGPTPDMPRGMWGDLLSYSTRLQRRSRKRKKRLQKVVRRFQQAADANPDGALIIDADARIEWISKGAAEMLGLQQRGDVGQIVTNLLRDPRFGSFLAEPDGTDGYEFASPMLPERRLLIRAAPYGNNRSVLVVRDVTRLHALQQMRKDFVANVSHELRTPLTVIMGYLEGLREDEELKQSLGRPLEQMWQQSSRMSIIIEDLLRLSRLESDPGGAPEDRIDLRAMLSQILDDADQLWRFTHELTVDVDDSLHVLGDQNELYSAFSNLVFNAAQYTPHGGSILVRWSASQDGGVFEVVDTGVGIEVHHLARLTERFYRVDKARSRELGGTGLGLAIVKHVLMRHDATLEIHSEPGEGSRFRCIFPATRVARDLQYVAAEG